MLRSDPEWVQTAMGLSLLGMTLPYYFYVLIACVAICAVLAWSRYASRVAAFVFSFSAPFALDWAVFIALFFRGADLGRDKFLAVLLGLAWLELLLFGVCAATSLWLYLVRQPIEPESKTAIRLGVTLLVAHVLHLIVATGNAALAMN